METTSFSTWLIKEMSMRSMSPADLAKKSGITPAQISRIMSGQRGVGANAIQKIAAAFKLPPEEVYRAAGMLPPEPEADPLTDEGTYLLQQLEGEQKENAVRFLRISVQAAEEKGKYNARKGKERPAKP